MSDGLWSEFRNQDFAFKIETDGAVGHSVTGVAAKRWEDEGHEVTIVTWTDTDQPETDLAAGGVTDD